MTRSISLEFVKFLFYGAVNSLSTYLIYVLLLLLLDYPAAYTISYLLGIFISFYLNARFVFDEKPRLTKALYYPLVYLVQYLLGIGLLHVFVELLQASKLVAPVLIVLVIMPVTFFFTRLIIKGRLVLH